MLNTLKQKLKRQLADKSFSEILTGSAMALVARVAAAGLALVSSLIVARIYGAEATGMLAIVQTLMLLLSILSVMGTNVSILRLIPEHVAKYSVLSAYLVYKKIIILVVASSIIVGGICFFSSDFIAGNIFSKPNYSYIIGITGLFVLFRSLMDIHTEAIRGLRAIRIYAVMLLAPHLAMLLSLFFLWKIVGGQYDPIYSQIIGWGVSGIVGLFFVLKIFKNRINTTDFHGQITSMKIISISMPMLMTASMNFFVAQIGVLILGIYRTPSEVGYYSIAVKLATLTTFVLQSINSMAAPKFSELFHSSKIDELFSVAKKSTKLIFYTTTPLLVMLILSGKFILSVFGKDFVLGYVPLLILVIGQFVNSISGSTAIFMNMTNNQNQLRNIVFISSLLNIMVSLMLVKNYGAIGVSLAYSISLILWNLLILFFIKRKYSRSIGII